MNFEKLLGEQVFKNAQFQSVLISFNIVHPFLFCICCDEPHIS